MNLESENKIFKKEYENQKKKAQSFTEKFEKLNYDLYRQEEFTNLQEENRLALSKYEVLYARYKELEEENHRNRLGTDENYNKEAINQLQKRINYLSKQ